VNIASSFLADPVALDALYLMGESQLLPALTCRLNWVVFGGGDGGISACSEVSGV